MGVNKLPTELRLCTKTSLTLNFHLSLQPLRSPHGTVHSSSVMWMEYGPLDRCPCGGVLLKLEHPTLPQWQDTYSTCWFWTRARHSFVPSGEVAVATGLLRMSVSGGSGKVLLFFSGCCSGLQILLCHHTDTGDTVLQVTHTLCSGSFLRDSARKVFVLSRAGGLMLARQSRERGDNEPKRWRYVEVRGAAGWGSEQTLYYTSRQDV